MVVHITTQTFDLIDVVHIVFVECHVVEIVSANQRCALSNCPNKGSARPAPKSGKVTPGPTGRSDRAVQAGLDRAGDVARNATRRAAFAITVIFAVIVAIAAIGFNFWSGTPPTSTNAPAAIEASPQAMVSEGGAASAGAAAASAGDAVDASASQDQSCSGYATYVATNEATEIDSVYGTTKVCETYNDVNGNPFKSCPSTLKVGDTLDYATPSNDRPDPIVCQHGGSCYKSSDLVLKNCQ